MNASQNSCFSQRRSHIKWMFDISPVCQANLAPWHAITGPITAVCGLEGTQGILAALTGPDRLIRSVGTQNSNSQTPYISLLAHNSLQVQEALYSHAVFFLFLFFLTPFFSSAQFWNSHPVTSLSLSTWHWGFCTKIDVARSSLSLPDTMSSSTS